MLLNGFGWCLRFQKNAPKSYFKRPPSDILDPKESITTTGKNKSMVLWNTWFYLLSYMVPWNMDLNNAFECYWWLSNDSFLIVMINWCSSNISIWTGSSSLDWIWIITRSGSSLLDHHYWISIITRSRSSLVLSHDSSCHRKFYRANPFSCWL